ncbi:MAG TPA: PQQ-dependent sugar dehydrogenase [Ktedonobacterales bacterium]|nr:PQQ-dependent sugar dehydrogenase [Ktedonobacterales bacterium]
MMSRISPRLPLLFAPNLACGRARMVRSVHSLLILALALVPFAGCAQTTSPAATQSPALSTQSPTTTVTVGKLRLQVSVVARNLDTVWALSWDPDGRLWYTERPGRLTRLGDRPQTIAGVVERGEAGLMGLEIDRQGRIFLMYTASDENRIARLGANGSQTVLVNGIRAASNHDGGRLRFGPDGMLYATTGDAMNGDLARPDSGSLNGRILRVDPNSGDVAVVSTGHRNSQGLCFAPDGRLFSTEHGPALGDEINIITQGSDGGWPEITGNGIWNYTPTIAPGGCTFYTADLIPQWKGSLLFVTLKDSNLHRLTFNADGSVARDEVLFNDEFGRLRDVRVGPDGAVYLATSSRDGRGNPGPDDDRILKLTPAS